MATNRTEGFRENFVLIPAVGGCGSRFAAPRFRNKGKKNWGRPGIGVDPSHPTGARRTGICVSLAGPEAMTPFTKSLAFARRDRFPGPSGEKAFPISV